MHGQQRAGVGNRAVRDLNAQFGQLVEMFDRCLDPFAVLAQVESCLDGLFDLGVVPAFPAAVFPKYVQLVGQLWAVEDVARIGIASHQPQSLTLSSTPDQDRRMGPAQRLR